MISSTFIIIAVILFTTIVQRYYFKILYAIKAIHPILGYIFGFIIRFWVILHELCHAFFWFLSGNKIQEIHLYEKTGWRVIFRTKNYIWDMSIYGTSIWYIFALIFNQIGLFLISFWPLLFWISFSFAIFHYFGITDIDSLLKLRFSYPLVGITLLYSISIPSFILSIEDIKNFFISPQKSIPATIVWSILNSLIFLGFVSLFSYYFVSYFIFFAIIFLAMFCLQILLYCILFVIKKLLIKTH